MEETVKERLIKFLEIKRISKSEFGRRIGVSSAFITSMRQSMQPDKVKRIALEFPELNTTWLLTGEGEMFNKEEKKSPSKEEENTVTMSREVFDQISKLTETVLSQQQTIEELVRKRDSDAHTGNVHSANVG